VVQSGRTFRPDPQNPAEIAYLLGGPGEIRAARWPVGYLVCRQLRSARQLEVFWNDRSVASVLGAAPGASSNKPQCEVTRTQRNIGENRPIVEPSGASTTRLRP
jgi:hypothetical protein